MTGRLDHRHPAAVFLFPGQGDDPAGALVGIYREDRVAQSEIDCILAVVDRVGSLNGFGAVRPLLLGEVSGTEAGAGVPQLASYAAAVVVERLLSLAGVRPQAIVSQSMGEIAALVCARVLDVAEGAQAVCALNTAFSTTDFVGAMVVVRADESGVAELVARLDRDDLVLAGANTPRQSILAGSTATIDALMARASEPGMPTMLRLPLPYATHHPSLKPVADRFRAGLRGLPQRPLQATVYSAVRRRAYTDADDLHEALADCVFRPVYLRETLQRLPATADQLLIEVGAGDSLIRCARACIPGVRTVAPLARDLGWLHSTLQLAAA
ncbi:MAG: hypothetical protein JWO63_712 [Frankiales bacterium]|jgi:acyl transferase domain-containing protein|nr:hypothetical protein [Frankiales bacterium]